MKMQPERRHAKRTRPSNVTYIQFDAGLGGIVLNASEEGLAFQAAGGIPRLGQLRLWISPNAESHIEVTGKINWLDKGSKTGGLQFAEILPDTCAKLRAWLSADAALGFGAILDTTPTFALESGTQLPPNPRSITFNQAPAKPAFSPAAPKIESRAAPWFPSPYTLLAPGTESHLHETHALRRAGGSRVKGNPRLVAAALVCACIVAPVACVQHWRPQIANFLIQFGENLKGSPAPDPDPTPAVVESPRVVKSDPGVLPSSSQPQASVSGISPVVQAQLETPLRAPHRLHVSLARSPQVNALWSAVGKGDSLAEVALAQLYVTGQGVRKNCEQAKVLLQAASMRGNKDARPLLKSLKREGCRR